MDELTEKLISIDKLINTIKEEVKLLEQRLFVSSNLLAKKSEEKTKLTNERAVIQVEIQKCQELKIAHENSKKYLKRVHTYTLILFFSIVILGIVPFASFISKNNPLMAKHFVILFIFIDLLLSLSFDTSLTYPTYKMIKSTTLEEVEEKIKNLLANKLNLDQSIDKLLIETKTLNEDINNMNIEKQTKENMLNHLYALNQGLVDVKELDINKVKYIEEQELARIRRKECCHE